MVVVYHLVLNGSTCVLRRVLSNIRVYMHSSSVYLSLPITRIIEQLWSVDWNPGVCVSVCLSLSRYINMVNIRVVVMWTGRAILTRPHR